ncbi:4735_t:CDS:2, partial [Funneliformis geosporum]
MNYLQKLQLDLTRTPTNDHVEIPRIPFKEFYEDDLRGLVKVLELSMRTDNVVYYFRGICRLYNFLEVVGPTPIYFSQI